MVDLWQGDKVTHGTPLRKSRCGKSDAATLQPVHITCSPQRGASKVSPLGFISSPTPFASVPRCFLQRHGYRSVNVMIMSKIYHMLPSEKHPGPPGGTFFTFFGFVSCIHVPKSPLKAFGKWEAKLEGWMDEPSVSFVTASLGRSLQLKASCWGEGKH